MLFLTHHKCASAWLSGVMHSYWAVQRGEPVLHSYHSDFWPEDAGRYRYVMLINAHYPFLRERIGRAVHVVRNPLAIVVSSYFSHLLSHPVDRWPALAAQRSHLARLSKEEGLRRTIEFVSTADGFDDGVVGPLCGLRHFDYDDDRILTLRMEDLVARPRELLPAAMRFLGTECPADLVAQLDDHSFEKKTGGRAPGTVVPDAHYRSGHPNDWMEHLPIAEARRVVADHAPFMARFYPETVELLKP